MYVCHAQLWGVELQLESTTQGLGYYERVVDFKGRVTRMSPYDLPV